jgi:hypothetical protein
MATLPWILIPAFLVPLLFTFHVAMLLRLWPAQKLGRPAIASAR